MRTLQFASFAAAALISGPILAQANPTAEAQLNGGFLGQQNDRLNKGMNANDPFTARASDALAANDYAKALAILRPYRSEASLSYYYLSGRANEGLGDYAAARKNFTVALKKRRTFTAAQVALALLEARHGDKGVATGLLQELTTRRSECAGKCSGSAELTSGIAKVEAALK